ncbi:uncharacterized protein PHALS_05846 [Plasmopara halstedii]|uniref:Uncharacterized protein n=1 Tax=Plasmopara halstedii TaxID=4781 RepID=A0A0P1ABJ2_PLAHL|nr:uncharacterized protein PHALS_05846 [Plasmopara halstedii]CEG37791.1 hypothetical protein PHALS_05846 [Plasmopara halstedii]|eukprot:XP_024574160.1 hypothetical protein PHALS_05846 [Plasmopara halstedii]
MDAPHVRDEAANHYILTRSPPASTQTIAAVAARTRLHCFRSDDRNPNLLSSIPPETIHEKL